MPNDRSEAEAIWKQYYGDPEGLARRLIQICLTNLGVVWQVFDILNNESDYDVGCRFFKKLDYATLQKLLETNEGIYFCRQLHAMLLSWNGVSAFQACSTTLSDLFFFKSMIDGAKPKPNDTAQPRKLSDAEISEYKKKAGRGEKFKEDVIWELPVKGAGFTVYNKNDTSEGLDQIGTKDTIEKIIRLASLWFVKHSNRPLQIGDLSRPGGIDTKHHGSHESGKMFDMRPLRNDAMSGNDARLTYRSPSYDRDLTKEFILFVVENYRGTLILFDDDEINRDAKFSAFVKEAPRKKNKKGQLVESHDDHLHVIFPGGD